MILPGSTVGVLGGGQLGRMFTMAARTMGYRVVVLDPDPDSPAGRMADEHLQAGYADGQALEQLGRTCAAVTTEFENIPAAALRSLETLTRVRPAAGALSIAQDRILEKRHVRDAGIPTAPFAVVRSEDDIPAAYAAVGAPCLLKRSALGYDGKGQVRCGTLDEVVGGFAELGSVPCVLEARVELRTELSVILARASEGRTTCYPVGENLHADGILDLTLVPARVDEQVARRAAQTAQRLADGLDYCGVMAVEFFVDVGGELLVNEIAPRPHNSGHYSIDACLTSQFEQQLRMLCDIPAGSVALSSPAVMANLLGDLWAQGEPDWRPLLADSRVKLHLYGKRGPRPGRKMGHFTVLDADLQAALTKARDIRSRLRKSA